jgi:hypothetical protein
MASETVKRRERGRIVTVAETTKPEKNGRRGTVTGLRFKWLKAQINQLSFCLTGRKRKQTLYNKVK